MEFSSKRNEYNANYSKEHYIRKSVNFSREIHKYITNVARSEEMSNQAFVLYGIELLENGLLKEELEVSKQRKKRKPNNTNNKSDYEKENRKVFDIKFHKEDYKKVESVLKKQKITLSTLLKATSLFIKNKKGY